MQERNQRTGLWSRDAYRQVIEVLEVRANAGLPEPLRHTETIVGDAHLPSPNDVAPVGDRQFFVTNDHGPGSSTAVSFGDLFGLNFGSLVYFDGISFRTVFPNLPFANGVNVIGDKLYVASTNQGTITTLRWDQSGNVKPLSSIQLGSGVDNIEVVPDSQALVIGAHPDLFRLVLYGSQSLGVRTAPSQVIRLRLGADGSSGTAATILRMDGEERADGGISATSVAAAYQPNRRGPMRLLLGSIFSDRILACALLEDTLP
jgi:hypothetical protein